VFSTKTLARVAALSLCKDAHDYHIHLLCTITSEEAGMTADIYIPENEDLTACKL